MREHICLACGSTSLLTVLSFPSTPLTDKYSADPQSSLKLPLYPLDALFCTNCSHLQLGIRVDPSESYHDYIYQSTITPGLNEQFLGYALELQRNLSISSTSSINVLDVGSNDGSFLQSLRSLGISSYGVEPAKHLSQWCSNNSLPTINCFFDNDIHRKLFQSNFPVEYDAITFNNVLANLPDPLEALLLARSLLKDNNSRIVIQTGYHPVQFAKGLFDYIYHEHYSYFTQRSISTLALRAGLQLENTTFSDLRGGTARFTLSACSKTKQDIPPERFSDLSDYKSLNTLIGASTSNLKNNLIDFTNSGFQVIGFGASHSTGTLIYAFSLQNILEFIIDDNELKHGKYVPGTTLIVKPFQLDICSNSVIVILAWQYFDLISAKLRDRGFNGPILRPVLP